MGQEMTADPSEWLPPMSNSALEGTRSRRDWKTQLLVGRRGRPFGNVANAISALRHAPEWQGVLYFNESTLETLAKAAPPFERAPAVPFVWADGHDVLTAAWLQHQDISINREIAGQAVQAVAREHCFHPIRDYLDSLTWDGIKRIDDWLSLYLGADPSDYVRAVGTRWLTGGVARVYRPGVKNDTCLILEGPQGLLKSTALRILAGDEFFSDDIADLGSKDSVLQTRGVWIIELAELDAMTRPESSRVKAFISRQVDRVRPPYGRRPIQMPRECIFVGTTNKTDYLKDETGGRRFWPVECGRIDMAALERDRDQLWVEARERFRANGKWWFDSPALIDAATTEQRNRYEGDPWDEKIREWIHSRESTSVPDVLNKCLEKKAESWTQTDQNRVARALRAAGWIRYRESGGSRPWRYRPGPSVGPSFPV